MYVEMEVASAEEENSAEVSTTPGSSATLSLSPDCGLVCVEFPGFVNNVDRMLETIGGEQGMSKIYSEPARRLELRFRPRDPYCHSLCANRFPSTNLLLRVRRRTWRGSGQSHITMDIMGLIGTTYKFQGMADFQYLAVESETPSVHTSLYDKILFQKPQSQDYFDQPLPLYIPPSIFSRLDTPVDYFYRPETQHREGYSAPVISSENVIGHSRARRPHNAIFVTFEDQEVPLEPLEAAVQNWRRVCIHCSDREAEEELIKMFARRPIWSRNAVRANLNIHHEKLKLLLPYMAYYMLTGPWRSLWVKFGYDPRKTPEAKIYQVLDFRIRCGTKHGYSPFEMPVKAKRSAYHYNHPITMTKAVPQPASLREITQESPTFSTEKLPTKYQLKESVYIFRKGMLPPYRQMFYQLCDLDVESIKKVIHRNDGQELECNERDGWCLSKTADELRDIISLMIKQIIRDNRTGVSGTKSKSMRTKYKEEEEEEEEVEEEEEFQPSGGSDNEMETEILDYM